MRADTPVRSPEPRPRLAPAAIGLLVALAVLAACGAPGARTPAGPGAETPSAAGAVTVGDLAVTGAWVRAGLAGGTTAAYMTIANAGATDDMLLGAETDVADEIQVHATRMADGQMMMVHLPEGLAVPAGGEAVLAPGGYHLMFLGLKRDLVEGEPIAITLEFKDAGTAVVTAPVRPMAALGSEMGG